MTGSTRVERVWHVVIIACSAVTIAGAWLPSGSSPIRHLAGLGFVFAVPGMAVAARVPMLREWGLLSAATWTAIVPISFAVSVAGTLSMVYLLPWWPGVLAAVIAATAVASSVQRLRDLREEVGRGPLPR